MNLKNKILILTVLIIFISVMGVYSAQYMDNTSHMNDIVKKGNGEDVFGCCSIIAQLEGNDSIMSFRRDSDHDADIHIEKIDWHGTPAIKQYKDDNGYFCHVIITQDGWMMGFGGIDDGEDSKKCEDIAAGMVNDNYTINKTALEEIKNIKEPYGRGHFLIKAPNGNYGFATLDKVKTGKLEPGQYVSLPNNYSLSRSGNITLDSDDIVKDMTELSQSDLYGFDRRDIITYDMYLNESGNVVDVFVSNEDGSKLGVDYTDCVDDVYFNNELINASDIPIAPQYKSLGSISFDDSGNSSVLTYAVLGGAVVFIIALSYGVFRLVRYARYKY